MVESLFNKVAGLQGNYIKKRIQHRCFPMNNAKYLRTPILKNICVRLLLVFFKNNSLFSSNFPTNLKVADVLPTHKKKDKSDIENYRPISILPTLSKIYERCVYDQMYKYFDQIPSKYQ